MLAAVYCTTIFRRAQCKNRQKTAKNIPGKYLLQNGDAVLK
jgi:hypothetical protein